MVRVYKFCSRVRTFNDKLRVVVVVNEVDILITIFLFRVKVKQTNKQSYKQIIDLQEILSGPLTA